MKQPGIYPKNWQTYGISVIALLFHHLPGIYPIFDDFFSHGTMPQCLSMSQILIVVQLCVACSGQWVVGVQWAVVK